MSNSNTVDEYLYEYLCPIITNDDHASRAHIMVFIGVGIVGEIIRIIFEKLGSVFLIYPLISVQWTFNYGNFMIILFTLDLSPYDFIFKLYLKNFISMKIFFHLISI